MLGKNNLYKEEILHRFLFQLPYKLCYLAGNSVSVVALPLWNKQYDTSMHALFLSRLYMLYCVTSDPAAVNMTGVHSFVKNSASRGRAIAPEIT